MTPILRHIKGSMARGTWWKKGTSRRKAWKYGLMEETCISIYRRIKINGKRTRSN